MANTVLLREDRKQAKRTWSAALDKKGRPKKQASRYVHYQFTNVKMFSIWIFNPLLKKCLATHNQGGSEANAPLWADPASWFFRPSFFFFCITWFKSSKMSYYSDFKHRVKQHEGRGGCVRNS